MISKLSTDSDSEKSSAHISNIKMEESQKDEKEDKLSKATGEFGRWQMMLLALLSVPCKMSGVWILMGIIFLAPKTKFQCIERSNSSESISNMTCYSDCQKYEYYSEFENTIISQWNLICERGWMVNFTQTVLMFGVLVGSTVFGFIADRYGRRPALIIASMMQLLLSIAVPFSPNYWTFTVIRFFLGVSTAGLLVVSFVILIEIIGPSKREVVASIYHIPLGIGEMIMPLFAYYLRSWNTFSIGIAVPNLIFLLYFFVIPESPKWLISLGKLEEASEIIKKAVKFNNLPTINTLDVAQSLFDESKSNDEKEFNAKVSYIDLIANPSIRIKNLCSCLTWFILGISFYGGNQYIGQTSQNIYLTVVLAGGLQIPGMLISGYLYKRYGRKPVIIALFVVCAISNSLLALPDSWFYLKMVSGAVGVSCSAGAFTTMYTYTTELFPTVARNMAMGASSTASRVGSMLAPFVAGIQQASWAPPLIFSIAPLLAAAVCCCLPETKGKKLLDRLEQT